MRRHTAFIAVAIAFLLSLWASGGSLGASLACENADCVVAASASPLSIVIAVALVLFVVLFPVAEHAEDLSRTVGVWRRFGAFVLDLALVLFMIAPLSALPILIAEGSYTGSFAWSFVRHFARSTDTIYTLPGVLAGFAGLFLYFYLHSRLRRPTVGQYVLGYRVQANGGAPQFGRRVVLAFFGLCIWPYSVILALRRSNKAFWWDSATSTTVLRVTAAEPRKLL